MGEKSGAGHLSDKSDPVVRKRDIDVRSDAKEKREPSGAKLMLIVIAFLVILLVIGALPYGAAVECIFDPVGLSRMMQPDGSVASVFSNPVATPKSAAGIASAGKSSPGTANAVDGLFSDYVNSDWYRSRMKSVDKAMALDGEEVGPLSSLVEQYGKQGRYRRSFLSHRKLHSSLLSAMYS